MTIRTALRTDDRVRVLLLFAGVAAAALYVAIVDVSAAFTPGYSHVAQPVSSLYQAGAPLGLPIALAFVVYNVLVVGFGVAVAALAASGSARRRAGIGAGIASLLTVIAMALAAWWLLGRRDMRALAVYSVASFVAILVSGPITAAATASSSPVMGLLERVTILSFIVWMAVASVVLARQARRAWATA